MTDLAVLDGFCGIGVGLALRAMGLTEHGIDVEPHVADTRARLGLATTLADITTLNPRDWEGVEGCWFSPPCPDFSQAGKGLGLDGPTGRLSLEPLRWVEALRPRWVAMEQVPPARPVFEHIARQLEALGYHVRVDELSAERFGTPQTRARVYLRAHRDRRPRVLLGSHQPYRHGRPPIRPADRAGMLPWVSMAEALQWPPGIILDRRAGTAASGYDAAPTIDTSARPSPTITASALANGVWVLHQQRGEGMAERHGESDRSIAEPAPTLTAHAGKNIGHGLHWSFYRPATTLACDPRCWPPGHKVNADDRRRHDDADERYGDRAYTDAIKLQTWEGCVLMGWPDPVEVAAQLPEGKRAAWALIGNGCAGHPVTAIVEELTA